MRHEIKGKYTVIYLDGRLDLAYIRDGIEEEFFEIIENKNTIDVVIDFDKVEYVSSTGLRILINALRKITGKNGTVFVI